MKTISKVFTLLLFAVLPLSLFAQDATVVIEFMKVTQESESAYLEIEKEWMKLHQKKADDGLINGWQLWRNVYAGYGDPYQYMVVTWYNDWAHSLAEVPEGFWQDLDLDLEDDFFERTSASRTLVQKDVSHQLTSAENSTGGNFIQINRVKTSPGKWNEYIKLEKEIIKPLIEEAIARGQRASWGVWQSWPYDKGQAQLITVDGYESVEQMTSGDEDLFKVVHPDLDAEKTWGKVLESRTFEAVELWEKIYSVSPESE